MSVLKRVSFWFSFVLTAIAFAFIIWAIPYEGDAKLLPMVIGIPTAIAGIIITAAEFWPRLLRPFDVNVGLSVKIIEKSIGEEEKVESVKAADLTDRDKANRIFTAVGWMLGYIFVVMFFGFIVANLLLVTLYIRIHAKANWWKSILMGGCTALLLWLLFDFMMKARMWTGILPPPFGGSELLPPL